MDRQAHWDGVYSSRAAEELSWFEEHPAASLGLIERSGTGRLDPLVDVGGGDSRLVDALVEAGYEDLTVLDVSPTALERARRRLGGDAASVAWVASDVTRWRPERAFALWHDRAVFHFLTDPADRRRYVEVMRRAVRPSGHVVIATFSLDGPAKCSGLEVCRYSVDTLASELGTSFRLEESRELTHTTPAGAEQAFVYGRFRSAA